MRKVNYDRFPEVEITQSFGSCVSGWPGCGERLRKAVQAKGKKKIVLVVECYPGVNEQEVFGHLQKELQPALTVSASEALLAPQKIEALVAPFLGAGDPVFGFMSGLLLPEFFDPDRIKDLRGRIQGVSNGIVLVVGCGASVVTDGDIVVYADLARWEAQQRFRRNEASNLGVTNSSAPASYQYKRAFFVDWRVADRWKRLWLGRSDFFLDTHAPSHPKLAEGEVVRRGLAEVVRRPFRVTPFFDPAPWGGQWMKEVCGLDPAVANYGWCFDCVPEENSLHLKFGEEDFELPALDVVLSRPRELLGDEVYARFGDEFPIRFDLLDTMGGGNLSFQVHPLTGYIKQHFGMQYTQDESYYLLDTGPGAAVYLGLEEGVEAEELGRALRAAQAGQRFQDERFVGRYPARKHDHFLIPAGTVHCSGANSVVLEISATPYIFTFKMWDWERSGLDGKPRPIHLDHGLANIEWERKRKWVERNLVGRVTTVSRGEGWEEECTGLHELEFIEARRHWFTDQVRHHTGGGVNVLNLVEGEEAVVESPDGAFEPFVVHYAETFIVPAAVGAYAIRPTGHDRCGTMKAFVRPSRTGLGWPDNFQVQGQLNGGGRRDWHSTPPPSSQLA